MLNISASIKDNFDCLNIYFHIQFLLCFHYTCQFLNQSASLPRVPGSNGMSKLKSFNV
jgi:hypothetical protein